MMTLYLLMVSCTLRVLAAELIQRSQMTGYPDQAPPWLGQAIAQATAPLYTRIILLEQQVAAVSLLD